MEIEPDAIINGLLDEIKRLTLETVALKALIMQNNHEASQPSNDAIDS